MEHNLSVTPAAEEELFSVEFQKAMSGILRDLQAQGLKVSTSMRVHDSADSEGLWFLGQFTLDAAKIALLAVAGVAS